MVILSGDDSEKLTFLVLFSFDDETKLIIESKRALVTALAFELLVVQTLERV
jgi:hypothetical protein